MKSKRTGPGRPLQHEITAAQRRMLKAIREFIATKQYSPTMKELGEMLNITAASAHQMVKHLERKGYVGRRARQARSLTVICEPDAQLEALVSVPLIGVVKAGPAMLAEENRQGEILVDKSIAGRGRLFALRVAGDSMVEAGMEDGDLIIVRQQPLAESGDIVVAMLGDDATVKRLLIRGDRIELQPANDRYQPLVIGPEDDLSILGKVVAVRRSSNRLTD